MDYSYLTTVVSLTFSLTFLLPHLHHMVPYRWILIDLFTLLCRICRWPGQGLCRAVVGQGRQGLHLRHQGMYRVFIKYCFFFQEFSKVCHLSRASTRLLLVVQKITSQLEWLYTRITLRALKVSYSDVDGGGVAVNGKNFPQHPVYDAYAHSSEETEWYDTDLIF